MLLIETMNCFSNLITKIYQLNKNVHNSDISKEIYSILIDDSNYSKSVFFDCFKNIEINDKNMIIKLCLSTVINRINLVLENSNINKLNSIVNYIDNKNRSLILKIPDIIKTNDFEVLPDDLFDLVCNLNDFEKLFISSICINVMSFSPSTVKWNIDYVIKNKDNLFYNINKHKNIIIELLNFYTPIYSYMHNVSNNNSLFDINYNKNYVHIYSLCDVLRTQIKSICNGGSLNYNLVSSNEIMYYIIYHFLLSKDITQVDTYLIKEVYEMLKTQDFDMPQETLNQLFECCKFSIEYCSLEDQIQEIRFLKDCNLSDVISLYAKMDLARYNKLKQKKKAFGLK